MFIELSVDPKSRGRKATEQVTSEEVQELGRLGGGAGQHTLVPQCVLHVAVTDW